MLFDECQLEATVTGNDVRKTSDEPTDVIAWRDDNSLAFTMLSGMVNTKKPAGDTFMKKIMKKFPVLGGCLSPHQTPSSHNICI